MSDFIAPRHARLRGFTLIELMIVIAIVAVLAAIAMPSYLEHIARSRRSDGKGALLEVAQWLERQYTISNSYTALADGSDITTAVLQAQAPRKAATDFYDISFATGASAPSDSTYFLQAVPKNAMQSDRCGTLTVSHTGQKFVSSDTVANCWNR